MTDPVPLPDPPSAPGSDPRPAAGQRPVTDPGTRLRTLFVGGPGRSGTTVVAQRLAEMDETLAFPGVELKFFTEKNGLLDLWHSLARHYSPNRAVVAMRQFRHFTRELIDGRFSQLGLGELAAPADWHLLFDTFTAALEGDGHPEPAAGPHFDDAARQLVHGLHRLALRQPGASPAARYFIDNTPHSVLEAEFLTRLLPDAAFLHVMRDPRSIAQSLRSMHWGPSGLGQCCAWVESYCRAWRARDRAAAADLRSVYIEDIAADPHGIGAGIGHWLGIGDVGRFFSYTDPATLNGWVARADPNDVRLLNRRLGRWAEEFGYASDRIGCRPGGPSGASPGTGAPDPAESAAAAT